MIAPPRHSLFFDLNAACLPLVGACKPNYEQHKHQRTGDDEQAHQQTGNDIDFLRPQISRAYDMANVVTLTRGAHCGKILKCSKFWRLHLL